MRWLAGLLLWLTFAGCSRGAKEYVVLYTSQDQFYAEPILRDFTSKTGIEVRPVFDTESAKTSGLANRLRAEAQNPQCDVFWSNEEMHTRWLVRDGIVEEGAWQSAGSRTRRLVINTNRVAVTDLPRTLLELTNQIWKGRVALAYPLFGTTKAHFLALRQLWGDALWKSWCEGLVRNGAKVVDGNSVVVRLVGLGECAVGLTDSDDIAAGLREGRPVAAVALNREGLVIPSTIALIRGAPRPAAARSLMAFLSSESTVERLVAMGALEAAKPAQENRLAVDWSEVLKDAPAVTRFLELIFIRS